MGLLLLVLVWDSLVLVLGTPSKGHKPQTQNHKHKHKGHFRESSPTAVEHDNDMDEPADSFSRSFSVFPAPVPRGVS